MQSNFAHLEVIEPQLVRLCLLAERYFSDDANTCLLKLRQFAELLAQLTASKMGALEPSETQFELLRRLESEGVLPADVHQLFDAVRRAGNSANHAMANDAAKALKVLKFCVQLGIWFQRTFGNSQFQPSAFIPPIAPPNSSDVEAELERLRQALQASQATQADISQQLGDLTLQQRTTEDERTYWERLAREAEDAKTALEARLTTLQNAATNASTSTFKAAAIKAGQRVQLDEQETRKLIDEQLRTAGWTVDSHALTYSKGARPEKNKNKAIAEYPTTSGPADYVLFVGLTPVATIEAKRKNVDVSGALTQAKRYSKDYLPPNGLEVTGPHWGEYQIPFAFSSNGRPYLEQVKTKSGIWFADLRQPTNLPRALHDWYTPDGLAELLKRDSTASHEKLESEPLEYEVGLRPYQKRAIKAVEGAIASDQRSMLVAMATGTGKTKTCIALIYRLLKAQRFRRVLFLVDRSALGEQAASAFKDTRLEGLQSFADVFGIKELGDVEPESATSVQIATVQGMVKRVLLPSADAAPPSVDQYDLIVVDECHRGYTLDRELSDLELGFRDFSDYISKYRRVLEYFDAVKIGLTATPALHTVQIFGTPIFDYPYREAVIDGYLVDHEPPFIITTELSADGIHWNAGDTVTAYNPDDATLEPYTTPDALDFEIEAFNKKVLSENFNKTVCAELAKELDPSSPSKTLIFCSNDQHADMVVLLLKEAFAAQYGEVDNDAVQKITGKADKPLELLRYYKNERYPNVAVTVDLLSTGVDIPAISNIVFMRRVNSRILYEQMLGRATRLCPQIGKATFRVFDAVNLYEALKDVTAMKPVVQDPSISFTQLLEELQILTSEPELNAVREQLIAKLRRQKTQLETNPDLTALIGGDVTQLITQLQATPPDQLKTWVNARADIGAQLDAPNATRTRRVLVSEHGDALRSIERGYGNAERPEDYLEQFRAFIEQERDTLPALVAVLTRPRALTRQQLRELKLELDRRGFSTTALTSAWRDTTNQDIAANIMDFIRQAANNEPILPYTERVERALQRILSSQSWTNPQRDWLRKIAAQTKVNDIVDKETLDDPDQLFKREGGGYNRLDKIFNGQLQTVLEQFNELIWSPPGANA
jgi:type I restriction enzyme, R subunit